MDDHLRSRLESVVGPAGVGSDAVVRASTLTQLRELLLSCAATGATVAPAGFATAQTADVVINVDRLDSIRADASSLLLHAGAAASWAVVREAAGAQRLVVAALPSVRSDRVGQSVAQGEIGHRTLAGVDFLTAAGELIAAGGRTLKDVVGYDLAGLALGSGERLGMIVAVTLRLEPLGAGSPGEPGPGAWRGTAGVDLETALSGASGDVAGL